MTVAIASHQRREPLLRLLRALDRELASSEDLRRDLEVLVVLDGSTDGSREAVEAVDWSVPVRVHWQPQRGLAAARNVGLAAAEGRLVWFLDDDLIPSPGLVARHRRAHDGPPRVVMGPCLIPPEVGAPAPLLRWWDSFYDELAHTGRIERFDRFTTANASAPAALLTAVGGFDESFVEYGLEDYELAVRLLAAGTVLLFDPPAVAWHPDNPPTSVLVERQRSLGLNAARLARLHPGTVDVLFPADPFSRHRRLLRLLHLRNPRALMASSRLALGVHRAISPFHAGSARRAEHFSRIAAHAAGVAAGDANGDLLDRVLGYTGDVDALPGSEERSSASASRQPSTNPTSSETTISR